MVKEVTHKFGNYRINFMHPQGPWEQFNWSPQNVLVSSRNTGLHQYSSANIFIIKRIFHLRQERFIYWTCWYLHVHAHCQKLKTYVMVLNAPNIKTRWILVSKYATLHGNYFLKKKLKRVSEDTFFLHVKDEF